VSTELIPLAVLMGLATYPFRAVPLLAPGFERLPERVRLYLRLVGPSVLAALAAVDTMVMTDADRHHPSFHVGPEWIAVGLCILVVALRRSLLIGLVLAAGSIALLRALGLATLP
jgi:branched-subunit amino acid transport protein